MSTVDLVQLALLVLVFASSIAVPLVVYRGLMKKVRDQVSQMTIRLDQDLGAGAKLIEVRDYYQQASASLKKMLDDAYKEGNRQRQDELKRLLERLEAMKTRALDKSVSILGPDQAAAPRKRRRRSRRPRTQRPPGDRQNGNRRPSGQKPNGQDRQQKS